jgi:hypothetical protein
LKKLEALASSQGINQDVFPNIPEKSLDDLYQGTVKPEGTTRGRVAYYSGCATNTVYPVPDPERKSRDN